MCCILRNDDYESDDGTNLVFLFADWIRSPSEGASVFFFCFYFCLLFSQAILLNFSEFSDWLVSRSRIGLSWMRERITVFKIASTISLWFSLYLLGSFSLLLFCLFVWIAGGSCSFFVPTLHLVAESGELDWFIMLFFWALLPHVHCSPLFSFFFSVMHRAPPRRAQDSVESTNNPHYTHVTCRGTTLASCSRTIP